MQCFVYSPLHVCLRVKHCVNFYSRLTHVLHVERFCISTVYIIRMSFSASNNFIIVTVIVSHVCVCVPVRSFLPPRASRPQCTCSPRHRKLLYIIIVIFAENASFEATASFACLGMTLLFAVLTKNDSFRSYSTFVYLLRAHILNINRYVYLHN